jgi:hypothetical protein
MGFLTDLLKDIPLSANLQEKLRTLEAKYAAVETENAILKDDKRKLEAENKRLKQEIESLTHTDDITEIERKILALFGDPNGDHTAEGIVEELRLHPTKVDYYLEALVNKRYIRQAGVYAVSEPIPYYIEQKGREYLIENNLI